MSGVLVSEIRQSCAGRGIDKSAVVCAGETAALLAYMTQPTTCFRPSLELQTDIMEDQKENRPLHNWACEEDELCRTMKTAEISGRVPESPEGGTCSTKTSVSDFSDPVYKEIAYSNGCVNRMSKEELKAKLTDLKLDTRGVKDVLKKRLKNYYKKQKLKEPSGTAPYYDYICVIDFEATCEDGNPPDYIHEIIEFPIALVNTRTLEIEDTFQRYVKPEINVQLSEFCVNLTGITQELVDQADAFPAVLQSAVDWMRQKDLGTKFKYAILTDGSWDMSKFLNMQCHISGIKYPRFAKRWCNIRKCYGNFYKVPRNRTKLTTMLEKLGMRYDGRLHCGLDDSKNIARIAIRMLQDGCELRMNERLHAGQLMTVSSSLPLEGAAVPQNPQFKN